MSRAPNLSCRRLAVYPREMALFRCKLRSVLCAPRRPHPAQSAYHYAGAHSQGCFSRDPSPEEHRQFARLLPARRRRRPLIGLLVQDVVVLLHRLQLLHVQPLSSRLSLFPRTSRQTLCRDRNFTRCADDVLCRLFAWKIARRAVELRSPGEISLRVRISAQALSQ